MSDETRTVPPPDPAATRTFDGPAPPHTPAADEFELHDEIGRGGMGVVYRATDRTLGREVAVKRLRERFAPDSTTAVRFLAEAQITGQLQHPGIPAVYRFGTWSDGRPFLAMKIIRGRTLDDLLSGGHTYDPLAVFESVAQAVGYAHSHGVVHRDLKPTNVMVGAFGEVQVVDWGLAKVLASGGRQPPGSSSDPEATTDHAPRPASRDPYSEFTIAGSILGTPAFMPPEQAAGETEKIDARSDVFGLGAILCVLLTGKPPFTGKDAESVRLNAVRGETGPAFARLDAASADPDVVALCKRCLAFDRDQRPRDGAEVAEEVARIRAAADERAKQAERDKLAAEVQTAEQRKRRRVIEWAAAAVAVVFAAGLTAALWQAKVARREAFDAETARRNEESARLFADDQRAKAQARLEKAAAAVETVLTRVGMPVWAGKLELQAERKQILLEAIVYFHSLGEEEAKDRAIRRQLARAHLMLAAATLALGEYAACEAAAKAADALSAGLVAEDARDTPARRWRVEAFLTLGHVDALHAHFSGALQKFNEAHRLAEAALALDPAADDIRAALADAKTALAHHYHNSDPPRSARIHAEALAIGESLRAKDPTSFRAAVVVLASEVHLAIADINRRPAEALARLDRAAGLAAEMEKLRPTTARGLEQNRAAKATLDVYRGTALVKLKKAADGLETIAAGLKEFDALLAIHPDSFPLQIQKCQFQLVYADSLLRLGKVAEAEPVLAEVARARKRMAERAPGVEWVNGFGLIQESLLAVEYGRAGKFEKVERMDQELVPAAAFESSRNTVRYNVACAYALLSASGPSDRREEFAAVAVRQLRELLRTDYFAADMNAFLDEDADLDPLRNRDDFRKFVADLRREHPLPPATAPPPRPKP